jgi:hypothetical protein
MAKLCAYLFVEHIGRTRGAVDSGQDHVVRGVLQMRRCGALSRLLIKPLNIPDRHFCALSWPLDRAASPGSVR